MNTEKKESYVQPALVKHELLRDITATKSGYRRDITSVWRVSWFGRFTVVGARGRAGS